MGHQPSRLLKPPSPYRTILQSFLLWLLVVPLGLLVYYALLYWGLSRLSGERLPFQTVADHLRKTLSGGSVLVAMLSGLIGFGTERWRKSVEAENDRARRRHSAIQEVEQLSKALDQRQYREALTLYRLFQERCQRGGLWQDIKVWEDVRFAWERKAPLPLQTWVRLVEGNQTPELDFVTLLEALVWGRRLDPYYWEEKGKELIETLMTPDNLAPLVRLFSERPESWKSLLRSEIIGRRLAELDPSIPENQKEYLKMLQNWREQPSLGIPLWEKVVRPLDSQEFTEWLKQCGFRENPFGPEMAELDPRLSDYGYWPAVLEPARGPRPALVLGAPGFGRTAAALLLHRKCLTPPGNPEEAGIFPVWLEMVAWPSSPEGWLERLGRVITETILQVCGQDPYALFSSAEVSNVIAYLFAWYFGPAASVEARLRRQGLPESALGYVLGEIEIYTGRLSVERSDLTTLWELIGRARPAHLKATYVLLDVPTFQPTDADPRIKSLAALIEMAGPLARRGIHIKLFLPEEAGKLLLGSCPVQPIFLQKWPEEDLREMLQKRLEQSSEGTVDTLKIIFSSHHSYPPDPDTWLVRSAEGSPRRLVQLGNQMLQEAWKKSAGLK